MPADKRKKLTKLGADALASALLDLANYSDDADSIVDRLLASPKENAKSFKKRLSSLKRRKHFISWGESGAYARDLASMLKGLEATVSDPRAGVESVAAFYEADCHIFEQCDDSNGSVGDVFKFEAAQLFSSYACRCDDKEWLADLVIQLNQNDGFGVRDVLFEKMGEFLPETVMRAVVNKLWAMSKSETDIYKGRHWLFALEDLAQQLKDPMLLEQVKRADSGGGLSIASVIEIAKLHFQCGDFSSALNWVERVPLDQSYMEHDRDQLLIAIYKKQNDVANLTETANRVFRRDRDMDSLQMLVEAVGEEKRASIIEEESKAILKGREFDSSNANFLVETGRIDDAERYIISRTKKLNGDFYSNLLPLAKIMLKHDRLVAASVIYRALLDSILARAKSKYYHHGIAYLKKLDSLAPKVKNWQKVEPHSNYLASLQHNHRLKSSFWSQYKQ
jgi:hypothetical protein